MVARSRWVFVAAITSLVLSACQPNRFVTGWVPYWGGGAGRAVIDNDDASQLIGEVSMMWYGTNADTTLNLKASASSLATTVASARAQGLPVLPTIADSQPAGVMRGILANPATRATHVQHIVDLVMANGYDGIDLDYEVFPWGDGITKEDPRITPHWVAFVHELGDELHRRGRLLSVTVPPVWTSNGAVAGYTVYAQEQIAPYVDRLRLMVYDWSLTSPGPIAPISWVNSVIAYSSTRVPVSKLQLGVPAYGRHWATQKYSSETCPDGALYRESVVMTKAAPLAAAHGLTPTRHSSGELTFAWTEVVTGPRTKPITPPAYVPPSTVVTRVDRGVGGTLQPAVRLGKPSASVSCTVQHTAYVPDGISVRQRAEAALAAGWSGIAIWALGYETADVYTELSGVAAQRPGGSPTGSLDTPVVQGTTLRVTGQALHPEFDLPVGVRLTVTPAGGGAAVAQRTVTARVTRAGMPTGVGPFHGFDESFTLTPGTYQVCATLVLWGGTTGPSAGCATATITGAI